MNLRAASVVLALVLVACGPSPERPGPTWTREGTDTHERPREIALTLPAYPRDEDLIEFTAGPAGSHRYFVDIRSISIGTDGIVRYSVVVRAAGGAVNVFYEGLRCASAEKRLYALGRANRQWSEAKRSEWTEIRFFNSNDYQAILFREALCPDRDVVRDRNAAISALRSISRAIPQER